MYPSLIIENNICFTTVSPQGTIESPTGAKFLSADVKKALLPVILASLMKDRQDVRTKMREATDPEMREFYDGLQAAIKVLMNAFYGVLASSFYRFNDPKVGASITAFARERIKGIIAELEADGVKVVYADTDSVFFQSPTAGLESSLEFARKTAERFSRGRISMEVDKVYRSLFSHGRKKRYAGKVAWPTEGEIVVRGYEIRRTDAFDLQSEAQLLVFDKILDNDPDGAIVLAKRIVAEVRDGNPPLANPDKDPIEMLVISRTVKEENQYVNPDSMSNVIAARKLEQMGEEFMPGMKVSWIVTDHKKSPMEVEPYLSGAKFEKVPDWEYYARRVAQTLAYVTEVYGWDEKALLTGKRSQQKSLSGVDFVTPPMAHFTPGDFQAEVARFDPLPGGNATNFALQMSSLGASTTFIGAVGSDPNAKLLRARYRQYGVRARLCVDSSRPTGSTMALTWSTGRRALVTNPGANARLRLRDVPLHAIRGAHHVHRSGFWWTSGLLGKPTATLPSRNGFGSRTRRQPSTCGIVVGLIRPF